jgi:hypothetical protein
MLNGWSRAGATLLGAAVAGCLLWLAAQVGQDSTGRYWAATGLVAAAGIVFALSQVRGRTGHPVGMFLLGFLPVLVVAGWVLIGMQPHSNWFRSQILSWSSHMGIRDTVRDVGTWAGVLAFAIGYTLGAVAEPAPRRRDVAVAPAPTIAPAPTVNPAHDRVATDEPVAAERREISESAPSGARRRVSERADEAAPVR